ncbi:hypothetical protein PMAYCL1PPCAC_12557 [Pristionchus mayeri]|uniref:Calponin-homology (CH) domain-containing protein n=1 Tax=Pristionchus mayeri TaxID=1317129 RepID=A0AAN5CFU8_9BILA|nr:hypothetical protein PMAYCL1PPCAC_12557 [Pristionchus mayeri]
MWNYLFGEMPPPLPESRSCEGVSMDLAPDRPRASIASTLSSTTTREEKRGFVRSTSHALEKLSNVIRKPSARKTEAKLEKQRLKDEAELEPRVSLIESNIQSMHSQLERMRKKELDGHPLRSFSSSNLRPSPSEVAMEELISVKEELAATLSELRELNDRHVRLQHAYEKERREKEMCEREVQEKKKQLEEGSVPFIDSDASPRVPCYREGDKENRHGPSMRVTELEQENEELRRRHEDDQQKIHDMMLVVRAAQRIKDEADEEVKRCRDVHRVGMGQEEDMEMWSELKRGREPTSRRNALLAWVQETLSPQFPSISVTNFSSSWYDGRAFSALLSIARPDTVSRKSVEETADARELVRNACQTLGIQSMNKSLLTTFGVVPDWNKVMGVVLEMYKRLYFTPSSRC